MFHRNEDYLFSQYELTSQIMEAPKKAKKLVDNIPKDQFLANSVDDLVTHVSSQLKYNSLVLYEDRTVQSTDEIELDVTNDPYRNAFGRSGPVKVNAIRVTITIPYTGDFTLWQAQPNVYGSVTPTGQVVQPDHDGIGYLKIIVEQPYDDPNENVKKAYKRSLDLIKRSIGAQKVQIDNHNETIEVEVRKHIEDRRQRLEKYENLSDILEIPIEKKESTPSIKPIVVKKIIKPLPPAPKSGFKPEPGIDQKTYLDVLSLIKHVGCTFEATPETYKVHNEEDLRNIMLAFLNGHFKGEATGETFRKTGKTDIKIESENRAAFVAECKVWKGNKELKEAIDQLLGYLTWRDCKAALIIFNKHNEKFSDLLEKIPECLQSHDLLEKYVGQTEEGEWDYIFKSKEDEGRFIKVRAVIFNIYSKYETK